MAHLENVLSEESAKMLTGVGGWTAETNCTVEHAVRRSLWFVTLDSDVKQNGIDITATANGDMSIKSEFYPVDSNELYKFWTWLGGELNPDFELWIRSYDVDSNLLREDSAEFTGFADGVWGGGSIDGYAAPDAVTGQVEIIWKSAVAGQVVSISRPSVMPNSDVISDFLYWTLPYIPDFMVEADLSQGYEGVGVPTPMMRFLALGTAQLHEAMEHIVSWDYVPATETDDGFAETSSLVDPFEADAEWLVWLAQLMGVSLDTVPAGGRSPWLAFESGGIDTWVEWEEDVDPGSIPGVQDTEWVDIETYSPDFYDTESARRLQIASGFNGVLGGTSESIIEYVGALLNTEDPDPFVYVVKHYGTNPYRILVSMLEIEDPDPKGDMIEVAVESATPAGTNVTRGHGVSSTARSHYTIPSMFANMWTDIAQGGQEHPIRLIENTAANGRHITLGTITGSGEDFQGGEVALARWYEGYAMYSGASRIRSEAHSSFNLLGDQDIRILISNGGPSAVGEILELASSQDKWSISVDENGYIQFTWENSGTNTITSTAAPDWGNNDKGPWWLRVTLDLNNDAAGHDVAFYESPTLYEDAWNQVGTTVTTAGVSGIDTAAASNLEVFANGTNPEDGASAIIYRIMLHNGIAGAIAADMKLTGEFSQSGNTPNTGTGFFRLPVSNIGMFVEPAAAGATNLVESRWTAQNHAGRDDYFYLGVSPFKDNGGNPASLGDTLVVTGLPSDTYDWTITLLGGGTVTGSTGTTTTIAFDSDVHGGSSILNIIIREDTGQTVQGHFTPDLLPGLTTVQTDTYGNTWTLTRSWNTSYFYEYSSFIDRDHVAVTNSDGVFTSGLTFDADETITVAASVRRFWSTAGITVIADHITTSGWKLQYNGTNIEAIITDGTSPVTLTYDEGAGGLLGEFNLVTLRRDVGTNTIDLLINNVIEDTAADPFSDGALFATTGEVGTFGDSVANNKFDIRYFGMFDRALSDRDNGYLADELARLSQVLPQATQTVNVGAIVSANVVYTPGFDITWDIVAPAITAGTVVHSPSLNHGVLVDYLPAGTTFHAPQLNMYVPVDHLTVTTTFHDFTKTGGA